MCDMTSCIQVKDLNISFTAAYLFIGGGAKKYPGPLQRLGPALLLHIKMQELTKKRVKCE